MSITKKTTEKKKCNGHDCFIRRHSIGTPGHQCQDCAHYGKWLRSEQDGYARCDRDGLMAWKGYVCKYWERCEKPQNEAQKPTREVKRRGGRSTCTLLYEHLDEVKARFVAGEDTAVLAAEYKVSRSTLYKAMQMNGVVRPYTMQPQEPKPARTDGRSGRRVKYTLLYEQLDDVVRRYRDGATAETLSAEYGVPLKQFCMIMSRRGVRKHKYPKRKAI